MLAALSLIFLEFCAYLAVAEDKAVDKETNEVGIEMCISAIHSPAMSSLKRILVYIANEKGEKVAESNEGEEDPHTYEVFNVHTKPLRQQCM